MRIYIAGPMTGIADFNFPAFDAEETRMVDLGHVVVNPARTDPHHVGPCRTGVRVAKADQYGALHTYGCWMHASLRGMLTCRRVVMLPGWSRSKGAVLEHSIAWATGMTVEYREDN